MKWRVGDVVAVPLSDKRLGFGLVLTNPLMAFFDGEAVVGKIPPVEEIMQLPALFVSG